MDNVHTQNTHISGASKTQRVRKKCRNIKTTHFCVTCMDRYGQWGSVVFSTLTLYVDSLRGVWRLDQHLVFLVAFLKPFLSICGLVFCSMYPAAGSAIAIGVLGL